MQHQISIYHPINILSISTSYHQRLLQKKKKELDHSRLSMVKLAILALLLVAVVAIAAATTITTTVLEDNFQRRQEQERQCSQQIQGKRLSQCLNYMLTQGESGDQGRDLNPKEMYLQECCEEVESVDQECRCSAILQVLHRVQQEMQMYQGQGMQQIIKAAIELPGQCQWNEPKQCLIRAVFV